MKGTNRDMYDSLLFWGVPKIYQLGFGVRAAGPDQIPEKILLNPAIWNSRKTNEHTNSNKKI